MNLTSLLAAMAVVGVLASMSVPAALRAFERGRVRLGAAALWHEQRLNTQLRTMEDGEFREHAESVLPYLLSTGSEVLLEKPKLKYAP
ncbi:MAG: hypothetical protein J0L84_02150 [Verrucomicrobia bacterium]|nr:hypothetical protein [Verrucomicrobiota bacterium]